MFLTLLLLLLPGVSSAQFAVFPATVKWELDTEAGTEVLTVENQGMDPLEFQVYLSDYEREMDGGHQFEPYGAHPHSCGSRLQAFPDQLSVPGGEQGQIRLRMAPGAYTCWGIVFVEKRTPTASGITVAERIAVKVLAQGTGGLRDGRVVGVAMDPEKPRTVVVGFENTGDRGLRVGGEIEVRDLSGEILAVVPVEPFEVLPARSRAVWVPLEDVDLVSGRYLLVAVLDFGADFLAGGQTFLEVSP